MILWLASYPKSGNTWLRALISNYLDHDHNKNILPKDLIKKIEKNFEKEMKELNYI